MQSTLGSLFFESHHGVLVVSPNSSDFIERQVQRRRGNDSSGVVESRRVFEDSKLED
jgi:hypothetical protein